MTRRLLLLGLVLCWAGHATDADWQALKYLMGSWTGEGSGSPGASAGAFTFSLEAAGHVMVRRSTATSARFTHEDYTVFYQEGGVVRAVYVDNEQHVVHYMVKATDPDIVCLSDVHPSLPRYRFTYTRLDSQRLKVKFEVAPPGKPEEFTTYVEGIARRKTPLRPVP